MPLFTAIFSRKSKNMSKKKEMPSELSDFIRNLETLASEIDKIKPQLENELSTMENRGYGEILQKDLKTTIEFCEKSKQYTESIKSNWQRGGLDDKLLNNIEHDISQISMCYYDKLPKIITQHNHEELIAPILNNLNKIDNDLAQCKRYFNDAKTPKRKP